MKNKVIKTEEEWRKILTPRQYKILREKGTEAPFTGKLLGEKGEGMFVCAACGNPLFPSDVKYESGSGWPSFYDALPDAVEFKEDTSRGEIRTEVVCARCGSHLGHMFDDGPQDKTGKRYCINSESLDIKKTTL